MAITEDASTPSAPATGTGSGTISQTLSPPAGATVVVLVAGGWGSSTTSVTISDSSSQTWNKAVTATGTSSNGGVAGLFYTDILAAAVTNMVVTATFVGLSGGRYLSVRVLNGTKQGQPGAAQTVANATATTNGTISLTTTVTGSVVYGVSDDPDVNHTWTANGSTTIIPSGTFNNSTDQVTVVGWKASAATGTPGTTVFGGTWSAATKSNVVVAEFLPQTSTTLSGAATLAAATTLTAAAYLTGAAALAASATLSAAAYLTGAGVLPAVTTLAAAVPLPSSAVAFPAATTLTSAAPSPTGKATLPATTGFGATATLPTSAVPLPAVTTLAATALTGFKIDAVSLFTAGGFTVWVAAVTLPAVTALAPSATAPPAAVTLPAVAALSASGQQLTVIAATLPAVTGLTVGAAYTATVTFPAVMGFTVSSSGIRLGAVTLSVTATFTAAVSGSPRALTVTFWALNTDGTYNVPLPDVVSWNLSPVNGAPGAVTLDYPANGMNFTVLRNNVTADRDQLIAIWVEGKDPGSLRALLNTSDGDDVAESAIWKFSGNFLPIRMEETVVAVRTVVTNPPTGPAPTADLAALRTYSVTAGLIMATLMQEAQARGALTNITYRFTGTYDTQGVPWSRTITMVIAPGTTYLKVLGDLTGSLMCEWDIVGNELVMWEGTTRGVDRTLGTNPVILRAGRNLRDAPRKHTVRGAGTSLLLAGQEGVYTLVEDATALARRGRRVERYISQGAFTDVGSLQAWGQAKLPAVTAGIMELGLGVALDPTAPQPLLNYGVGDWVYADTGRGLERLRIQQLTVSGDAHGVTTAGLSLHDLLADDLAHLSQRLDDIVAGSTITGTSTPTPVLTGPDTMPPAAPQGLAVTSLALVTTDTVPKSAVYATWGRVLTNSDGTAISDLAGYILNWRYQRAALAPSWVQPIPLTAVESGNWSGVNAGEAIEVRVAAQDLTGNLSAWSSPSVFHTTATDGTPPPVPSTPTVTQFLGSLTVTWDGFGSAREVMPPDFAGVEIHRSLTTNFTPAPGTLIEVMFGAGSRNYTGLPLGVTQFFKLISYDKTGNRSAASAQGSGIPVEVGYGDIAFKDAGNLVEDGSFELAGSRATHLARSDPAWGMVSGGANLGTWYAQGTGTTGTGLRALILSPPIPATTGSQYAIQLAIQRDTPCNGDLIIQLRFRLTGGGTSDISVTYTTGETANAWLAKTATPYIAPAGTETVQIMVVLGSNMTAGHWSVDRVEVREVIGTLLVQDAAITDAKIANLSVGKLTAGSITAVMIMAGLLRSAVSGLRYELDANGLRFYDSAGTLAINLDEATASALLTGTIQTGVTGQRIVLSGADDSIKFYPQTGETRWATIYSYIPGNYPNDIALEMRAINSNAATSRARMYLLPDQAAFVVNPLTNDLAPEASVQLTPTQITLEVRHRAPSAGGANDIDGGYVHLIKTAAEIGFSQYGGGATAWHRMEGIGIHRFNGRWYNHANLGADEALLIGEVAVASGYSGATVTYGPSMSTLMLPVVTLDGPTAKGWVVNNNALTGFSVVWASPYTESQYIRYCSWKV